MSGRWLIRMAFLVAAYVLMPDGPWWREIAVGMLFIASVEVGR